MTALDARTQLAAVAAPTAVPLPCGPLDGLVADAHEVATAMAALSHGPTVRIPVQALRLVSDLGSYGD
jgi:hypothetical protein